jgi:hypothetical protein
MSVAGMANNAAAAPPSKPSVYADVQITYAGQTFGFGGPQNSFYQNQDGGGIQFNVTTLGTPAYEPLPQIDTSSLVPAGNHWEVVTQINHRYYQFVGTCASTTFSTVDSTGTVVMHLFLNCKDLQTN